jgi:hypothetical protein
MLLSKKINIVEPTIALYQQVDAELTESYPFFTLFTGARHIY